MLDRRQMKNVQSSGLMERLDVKQQDKDMVARKEKAPNPT